MTAQLRKVRFIRADFGQPRFEIVAQHVGIEQRVEIEPALPDHGRHVAESPDRQRIFIGDKAERPHPGALHAPRQQHAERLVRQPSLEGIADEVMLVAARKGFHQQLAHRRHAGKILLQRQPVVHLVRQAAPRALVVEQFSDALGKIGRERKFAAHIGRHFCIFIVGARNVNLVFNQRFVTHHLAAEHKGVAEHEAFDEGFLDLAEHLAAARDRAR